MTAPIDQATFPLLPTKSTSWRLRAFSPSVYNISQGSNLYNYVDAMVGDGGVGTLKKQLLVARLAQSIDSTQFSDLDDIFGTLAQLTRFASESYQYNPSTDVLNSDQWDEVYVKDAWYRARIKNFFKALALGSSPDGLRLMVKAAISADCDIYEMWKFIDNDIVNASVTAMSQMSSPSRNEIIIRPRKVSLSPVEVAQLSNLLKRMSPVDSVVTINSSGQNYNQEWPVLTVAASSTGYILEPYVTGGPQSTLSATVESNPTLRWVQEGLEVRAPSAAFDHAQEYSQAYTFNSNINGPIDSVTYTTENEVGDIWPESNYQVMNRDVSAWGPWIAFDKADSPDNFPGGKYGMHPDSEPALTTPAGLPYTFPYESQAEYIESVKEQILQNSGGRFYPDSFRVAKLGDGQATPVAYRFPLSFTEVIRNTWTPDTAIASNPPTKPSAVTVGWFDRTSSQGGPV